MSIREIDSRPSDTAPLGTTPATQHGGRSGGRTGRRWIVAAAGAAGVVLAATVGALIVDRDGGEETGTSTDPTVEEPTTDAAPGITTTDEPAAEPGGGPAGPATTEASAAWTVALTIWFVGDDIEMAPVHVTVPATEGVARAAMTELLRGPAVAEADQLSTAIPVGTRLLDIAVANGLATVDLSQDFGSGGGSSSMGARVAQVVYTLTEFDTVDAVVFWMEGEPIEALGGEGLILIAPQTRADWPGFAP